MSSRNTLSPKPENLPGIGSIWQHSKGALYRVASYSRHSENPDQWLVTYRPVTGEGDDWTRSLMQTETNNWPGFLDSFEIGEPWHRFRYISGPRTWVEETAEDAAQRLLEHCRKFIEAQKIGCAETIYQTDWVIENAYTFIEGVCDIAGYQRSDDEDEEE